MIEQCSFKGRRSKQNPEPMCTIAQMAPNLDRVQSPLEIFNAKCVLENNCVLYQAYRNGKITVEKLLDVIDAESISQLPRAGNTVVRCPVCDGRGTVPYGFYPGQPRDATGVDQTTQCRSCTGRGIIVGGV